MTPVQISQLISNNKCCVLQLKDMSDNTLLLINEKVFTDAVSQFEEHFPMFKNYRRIKVIAKTEEKTNWAKGFVWQMEFPTDAVTIANPVPSNDSIGVKEYIGMFKEMMTENNKITKELMEKSLQLNNNDPSKWIPLIQTAAPYLGLAPAAIAGPPPPGAAGATSEKAELHFGDTSKMTDEQISEKVGNILVSLSKKIKGGQMLNVVTALDSNPNIQSQVDKIAILMNVISKNPALLDGMYNQAKAMNLC